MRQKTSDKFLRSLLWKLDINKSRLYEALSTYTSNNPDELLRIYSYISGDMDDLPQYGLNSKGDCLTLVRYDVISDEIIAYRSYEKTIYFPKGNAQEYLNVDFDDIPLSAYESYQSDRYCESLTKIARETFFFNLEEWLKMSANAKQD
jgi:hypothetical protein